MVLWLRMHSSSVDTYLIRRTYIQHPFSQPYPSSYTPPTSPSFLNHFLSSASSEAAKLCDDHHPPLTVSKFLYENPHNNSYCFEPDNYIECIPRNGTSASFKVLGVPKSPKKHARKSSSDPKPESSKANTMLPVSNAFRIPYRVHLTHPSCSHHLRSCLKASHPKSWPCVDPLVYLCAPLQARLLSFF